MMDDAARARVCAAARDYLGVPWVGQGRNKLGIDCTGLPVVAFRGAGFTVEEGEVTYQRVDPKHMLAVLHKHCNRLTRGAPLLPADIVVYGKLHETHVALLVDGKPLNAIHCPMHKQTVEARFDPKRGDIRGVYRWRF